MKTKEEIYEEVFGGLPIARSTRKLILIAMDKFADQDVMDRAHDWKKRYEKSAVRLAELEYERTGLVQIKLEDGSFVPNCRKVRRVEDFDITKRCFYELGQYIDKDQTHWRPSGLFKEIGTLQKMIDEDMRFSDQKWIDHHNYHQTI